MTRAVLTATLLILALAESKIFTPCELAVELTSKKYNVSFWQIPTWVCLAHHATGYNSSYNRMGFVGLFRLMGSHWCKACGVTCDKLTDDDIEDDINCAVNVVYKNHHGTLDGFNAWGTYYNAYCKEPWKDLADHDCHNKWSLLLLKLPNQNWFQDSVIDAGTEDATAGTELASSEEPSTESPGSFEHWTAEHVIFSDVGLMLICLSIILVVAGIIEIWRRKELPFAQFCMNA